MYSEIAVSIIGVVSNILVALFIAAFGFTNLKEALLQLGRQRIELWIVLAGALTMFLGLRLLKSYRKRSFIYDKGTKKLDIDFFNRFRYELVTQEMIMTPRQRTFSSSSFQAHELLDLIQVRDEKEKSDFEFINPGLNLLKDDFMAALDELYNVTSRVICGDNVSGWLSIPREWEWEKRKHAREQIAEKKRRCVRSKMF